MNRIYNFHICQVGAFELKSFGDSMFPRVFEMEMKKHFGNQVKVDFYSITSCTNSYNNLGQIYSFSQLKENHEKESYDLMVIGGGEFIHYEEINFSNVNGESVSRPSGYLWRTPQIEAEKLGIPVVWNCVGAGRDFVDVWQQNDIKSFSDRLLYASVRDRFSYERLKNQCGIEHVVKVHDMLWLFNRYFSDDYLKNKLDGLKKLYNFLDKPYLLLQYGTSFKKDVVAEIINEVSEKYNLEVVLLTVNYCHEDQEIVDYLHLKNDKFHVFDTELQPEDILSVISGCSVFVGTSFHGNLASILYKVKCVALDMYPSFVSKMNGLADEMNNIELLSSVEKLQSSLEKVIEGEVSDNESIINDIQKDLDKNFDVIEDLVRQNKKNEIILDKKHTQGIFIKSFIYDDIACNNEIGNKIFYANDEKFEVTYELTGKHNLLIHRISNGSPFVLKNVGARFDNVELNVEILNSNNFSYCDSVCDVKINMPEIKEHGILTFEYELSTNSSVLIKECKEIMGHLNQEILNRDGHIKQLMDSENRLLNKVTELEKKNGTLADSLLNLTETANKLSSTLENLSQTEHRLVKTEGKLAETESRLMETERQLAESKVILVKTEDKLVETERKLAELNVILVNKEGHIRQLMTSENNLKNSLADCKKSISWKITAPIRGIRKIISSSYFFKPHKIKEFFQYAKYYGLGESLLRSLYLLTGRIHEHDSMLLTKKDLPKQDLVVKKIKSYDKCAVNDCGNPLVSIIIPVYNQFEYTYLCIKSIIENTGDIPYEVIIADDCSTDQTKDIKKIIDGIKVVRNKKNLRFLRNCNNAAKYAKGKYILFLNNDTQVQPNWLKPLVDLIESKDDIGMVGSKLVYPDGTLQEAGGILWKDGSAWNYGRNDSPLLAQYNYVREVDYISGASIMIKHDIWKKIGGFDERFAPAYCEDSDLAFEVRKHGYKVMYQPLSVVVHFEGKSNGTDTSSGQKAYQVVNSKKFYEKWQSVLESEHEENAKDVFHARDKSFGKKTILVIDHYVPTFDKDCGSRWTFQLLKLFVRRGLNVKFIGDNFAVMEPYTTTLRQMGIEVLDGSWFAQNWQQWILENNSNIDFVFFERPHITIKYVDFIKTNTAAKLLYLGHDLHFLRTEREYNLTKDRVLLKDSKDWKEKELYIMSNVSCSYYPSSVEVNIIKNESPQVNAKMLPVQVFEKNEIDLRWKYDISKRKDILFVGGFGHKPNVDAVLWFVNDILPKVLNSLNLRFVIVGSNPPPEVKKLNCDNVIVKGFISDEELQALYDSCRLVVAPLRFGAGVKGKVVEAMKNGTPMITTDVGAEGVEGIESVIKIANSEKEFIDSVESLYNNEKLLEELSFASRQFVLKRFSSDSVWNILNEDLEIKD